MTEQETYKASLAHFGEVSQQDKLIEEMAELTQAILKHRRNPTGATDMDRHSEFVDVQIVMRQIQLTLDAGILSNAKGYKMEYLTDLIKQGKNDTALYRQR